MEQRIRFESLRQAQRYLGLHEGDEFVYERLDRGQRFLCRVTAADAEGISYEVIREMACQKKLSK